MLNMGRSVDCGRDRADLVLEACVISMTSSCYRVISGVLETLCRRKRLHTDYGYGISVTVGGCTGSQGLSYPT